MAGGNVMYPVMLNVKGKVCTVIGGGHVAVRKARSLVKNGAQVKVISQSFADEFDGAVKIKKSYDASDITGSFLVIAATNDKAVNKKIAADAGKIGVLVSLADDAASSDFISAASSVHGDITLTVSTNGKFPLLAKKLSRIKSDDLELYNSMLPILEKYRQQLSSMDGDTKKELMEYMISDTLTETAKSNLALFDKLINEKLKEKP
jgi:siroheme synthase-like protein